MVYRSLKDWNKRGKKVIKGERASARSASGVSLFSGNQVEKFPEPSRPKRRASRQSIESDDYNYFAGKNHYREYGDWDEMDTEIGMIYW